MNFELDVMNYLRDLTTDKSVHYLMDEIARLYWGANYGKMPEI